MSNRGTAYMEKLSSRHTARNYAKAKAKAVRLAGSNPAKGQAHPDKRVRKHFSRMESDPNYQKKYAKMKASGKRQKRAMKSPIGRALTKARRSGSGNSAAAKWMRAASARASAWRKFL
jgi:hypothetical protein